MITINLHSENAGANESDMLGDAGWESARSDDVLWVDVLAPTSTELQRLQRQFGFHDLAIEDVARHHQRPKIDQYDDHVLVVFYGIASVDTGRDLFEFVQLGLFVGEDYVVTVHEQAIPALDEIRDRWRDNGENIESASAAMLAYSILDAIVDDYFPVVDEISDRLDLLETRLYETFDSSAQQEIFRIKKQLLSFRRVVAPERDVINVLLRRDAPTFPSEVTVYFQDIYDHILRVIDEIDTYRDLLATTHDAHLSIASNRLNQVMKTLTASSIILMSMTLVASIYGMNFVHIPELGWDLGYLWALGIMAGIGAMLFSLFQRIDWL